MIKCVLKNRTNTLVLKDKYKALSNSIDKNQNKHRFDVIKHIDFKCILVKNRFKKARNVRFHISLIRICLTSLVEQLDGEK